MRDERVPLRGRHGALGRHGARRQHGVRGMHGGRALPGPVGPEHGGVLGAASPGADVRGQVRGAAHHHRCDRWSVIPVLVSAALRAQVMITTYLAGKLYRAICPDISERRIALNYMKSSARQRALGGQIWNQDSVGPVVGCRVGRYLQP